jgi:hypothetical protein
MALVLAAIGCAAHRSGDGRAVADPGAGAGAAAPLPTDSALLAGTPRCLESNPACGPMPFGRRSLAQSMYVSGWPRIADFPPSDPEAQNTVACTHDGECPDSGCGYACLSTRDRHTLWFDCVALPHEAALLRDHFCGCIAGFCRWFRQ